MCVFEWLSATIKIPKLPFFSLQNHVCVCGKVLPKINFKLSRWKKNLILLRDAALGITDNDSFGGRDQRVRDRRRDQRVEHGWSRRMTAGREGEERRELMSLWY